MRLQNEYSELINKPFKKLSQLTSVQSSLRISSFISIIITYASGTANNYPVPGIIKFAREVCQGGSQPTGPQIYSTSTTVRIDAPGPPRSGPTRPVVWAYNFITTWLHPCL